MLTKFRFSILAPSENLTTRSKKDLLSAGILVHGSRGIGFSLESTVL
jgi:hypothetical protein